MSLNKFDKSIQEIYANRAPKTIQEVAYLFDKNYKQLITLIPNLNYLTNYHLAKGGLLDEKAPNLYLWVEQKSTYTATITLSHQFYQTNDTNQKRTPIKRPDIKIKVYFDLKVAEAISACKKDSINSNHPYLIDCSDITLKWELNTLLERWLDYCLTQQYRFIPHG